MADTKSKTTPDTAVSDATAVDIASPDEETEEAASRGGMDVASILESMNDASKVVTTITGEDFDARLALASALTTSEPLGDNLNKTINLVDYVITVVTLLNKETGEVNDAPRIVLVDQDGSAYHATSLGLLTSLRNIRLAIGTLWGERPVPVQVVRQKGNNGFHFFTVNIVK